MLTGNLGTQVRKETQRFSRRAGAETLLQRAAYLPAADRLLMEKFLFGDFSAVELARLQGTTAQRVRRKIARLRRVLSDPGFLFVAAFPEQVPATVRPVAQSYFVQRLTLRQTAEKHHLTLHQVRQAVLLLRSSLLLQRM